MKIIRDLKKEADLKTPEVSDKIKTRAKSLGIFKGDAAKSEKTNKTVSRRSKLSAWAFAVTAVLVLAVSIPLGIGLIKDSDINANHSYEVVIDVNPTVKLSVSESDTVIGQAGLNEDGVKFLYAKNYVGKTVNVATEEIVSEMSKFGLLTSGKIVRVSAFSGEGRKILEDKQNGIAGVIENIMTTSDITTVFLSDDELDKIEEYYESHSISQCEREAAEELKRMVKDEANKKIKAIDTIVNKIGRVDENDRVKFSAEIKNVIYDFCTRYNYEPEFDMENEVRGKEIIKFIEELEEMKEELEECLEEIDEGDDDFGEVISDLLEIVKEDIFNED